MAREHEKPRHLHLVRSDESRSSKREPAVRRDEHVDKALQLMNEQLERRWTVSELARRVGLSRPAFARRFKQAVGQSPLRHLAHKRMERAAELVRTTDWSLARVATRVGYDSEFAFNRAFKRAHQVAPGTFRKFWCIAGTASAPALRAAA